MLLILIFNLFLGYSFSHILQNDDVQDITHLFFENLKENSLSKGPDLTDGIKQEIDLQVKNYIELIDKEYKGETFHRKRRGLDANGRLRKDLNGVQKLKGFKQLLSFRVRSPQDISLFQHKNDLTENWYAAVIENDLDIISMNLLIYKFDGEGNFSEIHRRKICHAHKLSTFTMQDFTIVLVAECCSISTTSSIYQFDYNENFTTIQNLNMYNARDVAFWENQNEIYMGIAYHLSEEKDVANYEVETPIYKWRSTYFDIVNTITTYGASTLTGFNIGNSMFVAVANRLNNQGKTKIYSEIFKYDQHLDRFISYQKILTNGAVDIKYFCFQQYHKKESYLIVTDSYTDKDNEDDIITELNSIIYKYVDGFFMPFQSIKINNLIEWQPFVGTYGKFALIGICKNKGIKIYQYDGWKFVEVAVKNLSEKLTSNVLAVHSSIFMEETVLVTANKLSVDIFQTNFEEDHEFNEFYDEMLYWCNGESKILENSNKPNLNPEIKIKRQTQNLETENIDDVELQNLRNLLENRQELLLIQEQELNLQPLDLDINVFEGDLVANNIIINNEAFLNHLTAETINNVDVVQLLQNIIRIDEGFATSQALNLDSITVLNELNPIFVNNKPASDIITRGNVINITDLIVEGNIIFKDNVQVNGTINNVALNKNKTLLLITNQTFEANLNINNIVIDKLTTKFLNKLEITQAKKQFKNKPLFVENIQTLKADSIIVKGFLNLVDISALDKFVLRKSGDQNITGEYIFEKLITSDLEVLDSLSDVKIPEDLVRIDKGRYNIQLDVQFTENVTMDNMMLTQRFNHINVKDDRLDILLKESSHIQEITGIKTVQEVDLKHPVNLQGKLKMSGMEDMNPLTIIDEDIVLNGDFILSGDVIIEEGIMANNIVSKNSEFSVSRLRDLGLKLEDDVVNSFVEFSQPLEVQKIYASSINSIDTNSFIVANTNKTQHVSGIKTINNDLQLDGEAELHFINGINFKDLMLNTLMITGDQTIAGNVILEEIEVDSVTSLNTNIGERDWNNLLTISDENLLGITEVQTPVDLRSLSAEFVEIRGNINNINFDAMIEDTVFPNQPIYRLSGQKTIQNLAANSINIQNNQFDMVSPIQILLRPEIIFDTETIIRLPNELVVQNVIFKNKFNNLTADQFNSGLLKSAAKVTFTEDQYFDNVIVVKEILVDSGHINSLNLTEFNENAVRHTENNTFLSATFADELVSPGFIILDGHVENLDLENVVVVSEEPQSLLDNVAFLEDVFINGELSINGSVNSRMFLQDIWDFVSPSDLEAERNMIINGSAIFAKGPEVNILNGFNPKVLMKSSWITHGQLKMTKNAFFDNVVFKRNLNLDGFLDQVNIDWLSKNYLSKTKDQNITAHYFMNGVNFAKGVTAPIAKVKGSLFGVHLLEFMRTALLDNLDQVFEEPLYLEQAIFNKLEGEYLVNSLNLANDVMRYDTENIVTGMKEIAELEVQNLQINDGIKIQNVDVLQWIQKTAMKTQSFQLKGSLIINNNVTFSSGVGLEGLLNHNIFNENTIMLRSLPQNITGIKTFNKPPIFASIIANDFINGVNMTELIENQVFKNGNIHISSPVDIRSIISTNQLEFNSLWNGVEFSKMIEDMKNSDDIDYHQENFDNLLTITNEIQRSGENRAYFLDDYKLEGTFENALDALPIKFFSGNYRLAILRKSNATNIVSFYIWDDEINQFVIDIRSLQIVFNQDVTYMNVVDFDSFSYLYMETELYNYTSQTTHEGNLIRVSNQSSFEIIHKIYNNGTKFLHSFILPDERQNCIAFLYNTETFVDIFCEIDAVLQIFEKLEVNSATHLTSSVIDGIVYIFLINGATESGDACIQVWKFDQHTRLFNIHQVIHTVTPNSISIVTFNDVGYLAISSERIEETDYTGQVEIRRFDPTTQHFLPHYQILSSPDQQQTHTASLYLPEQVLFAVLPSNELVLYVRTANPVVPLLVYRYRGVERFVRETAATGVLTTADLMRQYTDKADNHFLVWRHRRDADNDEVDVSVIKAIMQGGRDYN